MASRMVGVGPRRNSSNAARVAAAPAAHLVAQRAGGARLEPPLDAVQVEDVAAVAPRDAETRVVVVACAARCRLVGHCPWVLQH
jgi:hypothetical protein